MALTRPRLGSGPRRRAFGAGPARRRDGGASLIPVSQGESPCRSPRSSNSPPLPAPASRML
ncbi:hypothetical protein [Lysobacter gummosus]|uniref:hypothetical protein n=1 Tax=Lysobacter gummosus TaxID=262324 RepID=UPI0036303FB7